MAAPRRSPERQAEIVVMDRIERAMAGIDELPSPTARARVRAWMAETYPYADGSAPAPAGAIVAPKGGITP